MSKKLFKKSLGNLYRQKLIRMTDEGIELVWFFLGGCGLVEHFN
jgi:hypothetical protein